MKNGSKKGTNYHSRIALGILVAMIAVAGMFAFFTNKDSPKKEKIEASEVVTDGAFRLTADNRWDGTDKKSYAELNWDDVPDLSSEGYRLYQSEDGTTWDVRSTRYGDAIKVLNIYPDVYPNDVRDWMSDPTVGLGLIDVTPVSLTDFNTNSNNDPLGYLKNAQGEYQYDVVFVGTANANNNVSFNEKAVDRLIEFIDAGRGLLVGHDVLSGNTRGWAGLTADLTQNNRLAPYLGIELRNQHALGELYPGSATVIVNNNGYLMKYPHELENDQELTVPYTHSFGQAAGSAHNGTIWLNFKNPGTWDLSKIHDTPTSTANFYLVTNGNAGMIQTGHSSESANRSTIDERKIIANTLYNLAQITLESKANDYTVLDNAKPEQPELIIRCGNEENVNIRVDATDKGKEYQWYVEANTKNSGVKTSDKVKETITSNIAGYFYEVSNSPTSTLAAQVEAKKDAFGRIDPSDYDLYVAPNDDSVKYETAASFSLTEKNTSGKYVHVLAVDRANNVGTVSSQQIKDMTQPIDFEIERTGNEAKLVELAVDSTMDNKMKSIEVQIPKNTEIKDFSSLTLPADWYSFENSETTDYYSFSFAMETNNSAATIQTFLEGLRFTIKNSVNTSGNIKIILHEEAYTYWIDPSGKRHYYAFIPEVHTWMEAYNRAKTMSYRGLTGYLATLTSEEEHDFVYDNIGKTYGWLGGTRLRMTTPSAKRIDDESYISPNITHYTYAVGTASDWYWVNGPEAGTVFFDKPTFAEGGKSPVGVYNGFNNPDNYSASPSHEPNNNLNNECVLQFAQANETKYWNDVVYDGVYSGGTVVAGFYIEFSEYGGQTEGEEITDVCWNAAIPQKISLKAYDEQGTAVTDGDLLFDQQLRLDQTITVQPKSLEFYSFVELRETDDTPRGTGYTVSATYQEGKAIYSLRKAILHVRQVVMKPSNELVVPTEGYIEIKNRLFNSGNPAIDPTYQANTIVNSGKNADNPAFTNFILTTKPLTDDSDQMVIQPVIPSFYEYLGHYVTTEAASHQSNTAITAGPAILNRGTIDANNELWLTIYLQPNQTADGENITPQPYSWDYKKNDLGKIKTQ
ncbi:hypothetical protein [Enterococcus pallens]|uniref:DUF5057 domain-containing protein n=1 Tax=Enterococcus pallens ATCC BAA-351 TaxID=1158607 RepID=R2SR15_9ENTE|nr:hypothetical protein [Enterococcus pallens]EOH97705.1 hypothetical protein UAU_00373 [Enterococcus pallens ATCC BAA-351]EOU20876.1 hypothetical protein I588_01723 [Enterococcus pallens ATCC BAA-351]OJG75661.1 hypothetical protein RV10_GL004498 [Enterococcus pallens]